MLKFLIALFVFIIGYRGDDALFDLYSKYSNNDTTMDIDGLTNLMSDLGLSNGNTELSTNLSNIQQCFLPQDLLNKYNISNSSISISEFDELLPSLTYMNVEGVCTSTEANVEMNIVSNVYGYGTLAVCLVTILSILGIVLFPCFNKSIYEKIITILTSLAVGTLISDATLHLLPTVLGVDDHHEHSSSSSTNEPFVEVPLYICRLCILLFSIYALWLLEVIFTRVVGHGHSHGLPNDPIVKNNAVMSIETRTSRASETVNKAWESDKSKENCFKRHFCFKVKNIRPTAWMILLGDGIHNFVDGLSIGASFAVSNRVGISTTIAIFLHEIPHELGTYAILVKCGFTHFQALFYNFMSAIFCFIGFYVGASISTTEDFSTWIFSITVGMFYYISLVDLLPELLLHNQTKWSWTYFAFINIFMWLGFIIMFLLVLFEDKINF